MKNAKGSSWGRLEDVAKVRKYDEMFFCGDILNFNNTTWLVNRYSGIPILVDKTYLRNQTVQPILTTKQQETRNPDLGKLDFPACVCRLGQTWSTPPDIGE